MNLVDLFAILPYFVNFIVDHLSEFHIIGKAGKVVRLVRVTKILRVFKLVRHFAGLQSLFFTIRKAARDAIQYTSIHPSCPSICLRTCPRIMF